MSFIRKRTLFTGALSLGVTGSIAIIFGKRYLDQSCPRVPITKLPKSSACRNLIDGTTVTAAYTPHGLQNGGLLSSWSGRKQHDRWIHSFSALQIELPTSLLAGYRGDASKDDAETLMRNFLHAFLIARSNGPDGWLLDKEVPPLSFEPGSHLYGNHDSFIAFLLGTWNSTRGNTRGLQPTCLPAAAFEPSARFPSNAALVQESPTDSAGAVMYWHNPVSLVKRVDKAADYGLPWRFMLGGFQEWIVEKVSDDKVRVTYVMLECSETRPEFKHMPAPGYEAHVLYGQYLLDGAVREMNRVSLKQKRNEASP
ncbi:hypothetical protein GLAREA_09190 [Glarea lozoyensis ATCC 20868]|uniref:Uncharacterized protein n=1 Tax=Glarea lozoyensis (strain ATCC 20868 / MF5171) TaxID=1116229 RepID=S3DF33_GLAL2|nr:uncharacterized protein GLAREA_09190 [Glarea lozoyensis ATCC 20868]EPE37027.1 hypothetical protein GLAREA_09190 [Glarea lozoyensis ATCC 20868]